MMNPTVSTRLRRHARQAGFSLIELMISITISLIIVAGMSAMMVNVSGTNSEMAKANSQIENGRFAIQALENELVHAGFWGGYVPQFDDMYLVGIPADTPNQVPDPCQVYTPASWDHDYINSLIGISLQAGAGSPGACNLAAQLPNTDYLVVRRAATCIAGDTNCDAERDGKLYFQYSLCAQSTRSIAQPLGNGANTIGLAIPTTAATTSGMTNAYVGMTIRILSGAGVGQTRKITAYDSVTYMATVNTPWTTTPNNTSEYVILDAQLATDGFDLHKRSADCATAPIAEKRKFVSNIYYIRNFASTAGDGIPTLVRSSFDPDGAPNLAHQAAEAIVEGIERFAVELGIDDTVARCGLDTAVDFTQPVDKVARCTLPVDPEELLPTNRGDGIPDRFVRCTAAVPCSVEQLRNVVAAKVYLLVRNAEASRGHVDDKTYCVGETGANGVCPVDRAAGPFNDGFKRHLFATTIRLTSISGRRETP